MTNLNGAEKREFILACRDRARKDKLYLSELLGCDFVASVHQELFDTFIQWDNSKPFTEQDKKTKRLIMWPRGHYKTTAVVVDIVQLLLNFPDARILIMQGSTKVTQNLLHAIQAHFTGENPQSNAFRELFSEYCGPKLGTKTEFTVLARKNKGLPQASVTVASPRSVKTGQHYDIAYFDDLVHDQNFNSALGLEKVKTDYFLALPLIDPPFFTIITGTRYAHEDLYAYLLSQNLSDWRVSIVDCWKDGDVRFPYQQSRNGEKYIGFTRERLLAIQASNPAMFAGQYLNQPIVQGGQRFTQQLLEKCCVLESIVGALSEPILMVDVAATAETTSDDSVVMVGKHDASGVIHIVDVAGGQWPPHIVYDQVIAMAVKHRPNKIFYEGSAAGKYFASGLRIAAQMRSMTLPLSEVKVTNRGNDKDNRIRSLEFYLINGKLKFFFGLPEWEKIVSQFEKFPQSKHDDYPDTIALLVHQLTGQVLIPTVRPHSNHLIALSERLEQEQLALQLITPTERDDGLDGFLF